MPDPLESALTIPAFGVDLPVDVELTGRVAASPPAVSPACAHERQTVKQGDVLVVGHTDGQIHPGCGCGQGIFHRDTRYLSGLSLRLAGRPFIVLSSTAEQNFFSRTEAMNEAWTTLDGRQVRRETLHLGRTRIVEQATAGGIVRERMALTNFNPFPITAPLTLELRADFKDIFEVRGFFGRERAGTFLRPVLTPDAAELLYMGADGCLRHTVVRVSEPWHTAEAGAWPESHETGATLAWDIEIPGRGGTWVLDLVVAPARDGAARLAADEARPGAVDPVRLEALDALPDGGNTHITSEHEGFATFVSRGLADLAMLVTPTPHGPFPTAGIPWYACPFGRDGLITALQSLPLGPALAESTLRFLAAHQGQRVDGFRDEEPGKILHELRLGELAALGEVPHSPYYGTIDATPLWLVLLHETWRWTGRDDLVRELWPAARQALAWIDAYGDADHDGFVEYARKGDKGLANQGWKDSHDAIGHRDGTLAEGPIALAEVQGYVFDAKRRMAELARLLGDADLAAALARQAGELKRAFNEAFWSEEDGGFVIALDGQKRQVRARASNPGHALWSGIIDAQRVPGVVATMLAPDMFNGWGIRTLSSGAASYNPMSYHNGTVWPHDAALIAKGMADAGYKDAANVVLGGLYDVSLHFPYQRLPELFCGFPRAGRFAKPVPYPVSCSPQAWSAGAPLLLLAAALGLEPSASEGVLRLRQPTLPGWLGHVALSGLRIGDASVDLAFRRTARGTAVEVTGRRGDLRVEVIT